VVRPLPAFVIRRIETLDGDACGQNGEYLRVHVIHPFSDCSRMDPAST